MPVIIDLTGEDSNPNEVESEENQDKVRWRIVNAIDRVHVPPSLKKVVSKTENCQEIDWMYSLKSMTIHAESDEFLELVRSNSSDVLLDDEGFGDWIKASTPPRSKKGPKENKRGKKLRLECLKDYLYMMYACVVISELADAQVWLDNQKEALEEKSENALARGTDSGDALADTLNDLLSEVEEITNCMENQLEAVLNVKSALEKGDVNVLLDVLELGTFRLDF